MNTRTKTGRLSKSQCKDNHPFSRVQVLLKLTPPEPKASKGDQPAQKFVKPKQTKPTQTKKTHNRTPTSNIKDQ